LPETGQFDQQPDPSLPVEVISLCQRGAQFVAAPPSGGSGENDHFCCFWVITSTAVE